MRLRVDNSNNWVGVVGVGVWTMTKFEVCINIAMIICFFIVFLLIAFGLWGIEYLYVYVYEEKVDLLVKKINEIIELVNNVKVG